PSERNGNKLLLTTSNTELRSGKICRVVVQAGAGSIERHISLQKRLFQKDTAHSQAWRITAVLLEHLR
ncbi:hypothetical protein KIL84_016188, partial [Mauremys mutica]